MDLYKIEVVLSAAACQVKAITVDGVNKPPGYAINAYPSGSPGGAFPVLRLSALDVNAPFAHVGSVVTISSDPKSAACPTIDSALAGGKFWYAYSNTKLNCCGTTRA